MITQAVLLAGGRGSRLGPLTADTPKPLLPISGKPMIVRLIERLNSFGFDRVLVLAGYRGGQVAAVLAETAPKVQVVIEPTPLGTAGALRRAAICLDEQFLVLNADTYFGVDYRAFADRAPVARKWWGKLAIRRGSELGGVVMMDRFGRVITFRTELGPLLSAGLYLLQRRIIDSIAPGFCSLERDVFPGLAPLLHAELLSGPFIDIGTPADYSRAAEVMGVDDGSSV